MHCTKHCLYLLPLISQVWNPALLFAMHFIHDWQQHYSSASLKHSLLFRSSFEMWTDRHLRLSQDNQTHDKTGYIWTHVSGFEKLHTVHYIFSPSTSKSFSPWVSLSGTIFLEQFLWHWWAIGARKLNENLLPWLSLHSLCANAYVLITLESEFWCYKCC